MASANGETDGAYREIQSGLSVGITEARVLWELHERGEVRPTDLLPAIDATAATITKTITKLRGRGFVMQRPHPDDRRAQLVVLTATGADAAAALMAEGARMAVGDAAPRGWVDPAGPGQGLP